MIWQEWQNLNPWLHITILVETIYVDRLRFLEKKNPDSSFTTKILVYRYLYAVHRFLNKIPVLVGEAQN